PGSLNNRYSQPPEAKEGTCGRFRSELPLLKNPIGALQDPTEKRIFGFDRSMGGLCGTDRLACVVQSVPVDAVPKTSSASSRCTVEQRRGHANHEENGHRSPRPP